VPNRVWCADDKGEFPLANRRDCYPLTLTDFASRYLLACEALSTTKERYACAVFERAFAEYGLPQAIRTDTGVPFASAHALYGRSKLAVWWLRLGIALERIAPGPPEQNGRHERLPLTLKTEATRPALANVLQPQARFATFVHQDHPDRPHQALDMATPARRYQPSPRPYRGLAELESPHAWTAVITTCGRICYQRRKINVTRCVAARSSGSSRPTTTSGWSPSWTTT
jgi:putative transposase